MIRCTVARVDLNALRANFHALTSHLAKDASINRQRGVQPSTPPAIIAVVKANAYGHGSVPVARALEEAGAPWLAVADIEEGVELRESGVRAKILVFGALSVSDLKGVITHGLTPTISSPAAARALQMAAAARSVQLSCHLKIDTGMHRLGFRHDHLDRTLPALFASPNLTVEAVHTHFATAEDPESSLFDEQRMRFDAVCTQLAAGPATPFLRHAANSAAVLRDSRVWYDLVRPGLLLYGVAPPPLATTLSLAPVMTLVSRVVAVKGLRVGDIVGYGARFHAERPTTMAVVPAGYADGLDRRLEGRGYVLVRGQRAPIIGAVSMDMLTVDVTDIAAVSPGDDVVLLGQQGSGPSQRIDAREVASWIGTIPYEVLCRLGSRVERRYT